MTYHIEFKDNLPALYTSPKPEVSNYQTKYKTNNKSVIGTDNISYRKDLEKHLASFLSLLVEPEFKVGKTIYFNKSEKGRIEEIWDDKSIEIISKYGQRYCTDRKYLSHYQPGQKLESPELVWVKGYIKNGKDAAGYHVEIIKWQQTEEPEEYLTNYNYMDDLHTSRELPNPAHAAFLLSVEQGEIQQMETKYLKQ